MNCIRCGRETQNNQVFCGDCLQIMDRDPVKPGTAVLLPSRPAPTLAKKQVRRRKALTPEEQVLQLRKTVKRLSVTIAVLLLVFTAAIAILTNSLLDKEASQNIGRNYSTVGDTTGS